MSKLIIASEILEELFKVILHATHKTKSPAEINQLINFVRQNVEKHEVVSESAEEDQS